jgi:Mg2+-importing ATPase
MLKNITRQLQALLSRHLPRRLTQRDPLPNAKNIAGAAIPAPDRTLPERGGDG